MSDEHTHHWPKSGTGCYCGAKVQCTQYVPNEGMRPSWLDPKNPWQRRCENEAAPGTQRCAEHGGRAITPTEAA